MFSHYFTQKTKDLQEDLAKKTAVQSKKQGERFDPKKIKKDLNLFEGFYGFLSNHLPLYLDLAIAKLRNSDYVLSKQTDLLIYKKLCPNYFELTNKCVLYDNLYTFMSLETELILSRLNAHLMLTKTVNSLGSQEPQEIEPTVKYSILFAYGAKNTLAEIKENLLAATFENFEEDDSQIHCIDMLCVLDQGLIIRDPSSDQHYKGILTQEDTLMWFYIMLLEYLNVESKYHIQLRDYVKVAREYEEC